MAFSICWSQYSEYSVMWTFSFLLCLIILNCFEKRKWIASRAGTQIKTDRIKSNQAWKIKTWTWKKSSVTTDASWPLFRSTAWRTWRVKSWRTIGCDRTLITTIQPAVTKYRLNRTETRLRPCCRDHFRFVDDNIVNFARTTSMNEKGKYSPQEKFVRIFI